VHAIALGGVALHAGGYASVVLQGSDGPLTLAQGGACAAFDALHVVRADHGVTVADAAGRIHIDLVEHFMAALGGLGISAGVRATIRGPELPLLDGGARRYADALGSLGVPDTAPRVRIARAWRASVGASSYSFTPDVQTTIEVRVAFDHPLIEIDTAHWDGDRASFLHRIAPARTFGFLRDAGALSAAGRAKAVDTSVVVVLCEDGSTLSSPPPGPDECARHKLLDLIGDLTLCCGVPLGRITADRPGHAATTRAIAQAITAGVFKPV
jgi:UDP-3-O-[3-hydroxymyristoyl] N-acetylglucosamine deacetylase